MVEHTSTGLQQQMRPPADPLQLLLLRKALAHHHVDGGLDKPRRNRFTIPPPLTIVRDETTIIFDVGAERCHRLLDPHHGS